MATNESIMALPLASKFKAEARAMADRGLSTYEAVYQLNKLEEQDKPRADAIMALHEHNDYQRCYVQWQTCHVLASIMLVKS